MPNRHLTGLAERGLKPASELAKQHTHGERVTYMGGCRCQACRKANSHYENQRQKARRRGDWNGIVSAAKAKNHLLWLSENSVGRNAVSAATDISRTILQEIRSGKRKRIRARTERLILAVTTEMASHNALIDAAPTWKRINALLREGYTRTELAKRLGSTSKTPALQIGKTQCTVRKAQQVKRLHKQLTTWDEVGHQQSQRQSQATVSAAQG